jgi:hypothetical protein
MESGTVAQVGSTTVIHSAESDSDGAETMDASGANVRFRVMGKELTELTVLSVDP